ncbi:Proteasome activator BLM10 [Tilletia horrida]|uniref:Proteasome activator BLM10 n=1 Tax=Tilletia horrida TaxID=155126 RepID=A0AAN6GUH0_9BASI|nr:Proteasome activator BLM10 [Tilletia horrida]KAK0557500.1 Proteasome activator BLM10 [Tilletia horrida]KAK0567883.1 Proteasome activator BLM10 [Tilletia horrida]
MDNEELDAIASDNEAGDFSDAGSEDEEIATEQLDAAKAQAAKADEDQGGSKGSSSTGGKKKHKKKLSEHERRKAQLIHSTSLPFETESLEDFDKRLDNIIQRLTECIEAKDPLKHRTQANLARLSYELAVTPNLPRWITTTAAKRFMSLITARKTFQPRLQLRWRPLFDAIEPILSPKSRAIQLGSGVGAAAAGNNASDTSKISTLLTLALHANWFFVSEASYAHSRAVAQATAEGKEVPILPEDAPDLVDEMLHTFLPLMDGSDLDSVIQIQSLLVHFLPVSHPQKWLPAMFRLWESFNSSLFTDQMLDLLARLSTYHMTEPNMSSDKHWKFRNGGWIEWTQKREAKRKERKAGLKEQAKSSNVDGDVQMDTDADKNVADTEDELDDADEIDDEPKETEEDALSAKKDAPVVSETAASANGDAEPAAPKGLKQDIGIFTTAQFELIMTELLRSCGLPVGTDKTGKAVSMLTSTGLRTGVDATASRATLGMKKTSDRMSSFATIIAYSLAEDGPKAGVGNSEVPSPQPSGTATPTTESLSNGQAKGQSSLAVPGTVKAVPRQTFLAGSRALDSVARFIQATESFFHPSNWGFWQLRMSTFLHNLSWQVLRRVKKERKHGGKYCRIPKAYRITKDIETEFVLSLRTVCLLSMFSKDAITIAKTQGTLKNMALMKPELVLPAVLERSYSSLEALETTHRTTAIITALGSLAYPLLSQQNYPQGGQHLVPLLHLCIPGIDLNDPLKTMSTGMFILMSMLTISVDDLTRPELAEAASSSSDATVMDVDQKADAEDKGKTDDNKPDDESNAEAREARAEAEQALRLSTSQFEDWVVQFYNSVLRVFDALPEEGSSGRTGGRVEERVIATLNAACDATCQALSDHMFDIAFNIVFRHCTTTITSNAVTHIGSLVSCFSRANGAKVLNKILPMCAERIREELKHGAGSTRTTSTSQPISSDTALHHYLSILGGALNCMGTELLPHKELIISLLQDVSEHCHSERAYTLVARIYAKVFAISVQIFPAENRFVNPATWKDPKFQSESHLWWGKLYSVKDVEVAWHVPSDAEIEFALELLRVVVDPLLNQIETLLAKPGSERDKIWSSDFCRAMTFARTVFECVPNLIKLEENGGGASVTDLPSDVSEFIKIPPRFRSGFILTDPTDTRYQQVFAFRERFGDLMLLAAKTTRGSAAEDQIDCVKQVIRSISTYLSSYAYSSTDYRSCSAALQFVRKITKLYAQQTTFPRKLWVRKFSWHQMSVARLNSFHRKRTARDDQLIAQILDFSLSDYVIIRKRAQSVLKTIASHYDGTRFLSMPKLLENLKASTADDQMKGALHLLGSSGFFRFAFDVDSRLEEYLEAMLAAQNRSKPSIQKLLRKIVQDLVGSVPEIMTIEPAPFPLDLSLAIDNSREDLYDDVEKADTALLEKVRQQARGRIESKDGLYQRLLPRVLEFVQSKDTHWTYATAGARLLRALTRKDKPLNRDLVVFAAQSLGHEHPKIRRYAQITLSKNLYYLKLRTLAANDRDLADQKITNPLKKTETLPQPLPSSWVESDIASYSEGKLTVSTHLKDKTGPGWLVLPTQRSYYVLPQGDEPPFAWESASLPAVDAVKEIIFDKEWWKKYLAHASQEKDRNYLSSEAMAFFKGAFQIYGIDLLQYMQDEVTSYIDERDRHKHRAAAELICSVIRGSKHWPLKDQERLWAWFESIWPAILKACSPDSISVWLMSIENILYRRDPHRIQPLINLIVNRARDSIKKGESDQSPWEQAKAQNLLRSVMLSLQTKFTAWAPEFVNIYCDHIGHDFQEVRSIISESLADLDLLGTPTSFPSTTAFLEACGQGRGSLLSKSELYEARLEKLAQNLRLWRTERVPTAVGTSQYDRASLTTLNWISTTLIDHRNSAIAGQTIRFLPEIFSMMEIFDNTELSATAKKTLNEIAVYPFTADLIEPLIRKLLEVIRSSHESWRMRLDVLPILQIAYFRNLFYLTPAIVQEVNDLLLELLQDAHLEVREMASATLSGIIRCSQRSMIKQLKENFTRQVKSVRLPKRDAPDYQTKLLKLHGGILGVVALLSASPYTVPDWMPSLIVDTVAAHTDDPVPISTTVRRCAASWKATHQDTWHEERSKFTDEQLQEVTEWTLGRSDYFV